MLALLGASAVFMGCSGPTPPAPNPQDEQLAKLSHTWTATAVTMDSQPVSGYVGTFKLTISGDPGQTTFDYTTSGRPTGPTPWPPSGQWTFGTDFSTVVIRSDYDLPVTYSVNATTLQLTFDYGHCPNTGIACDDYTGRMASVAGQWSFTFSN